MASSTPPGTIENITLKLQQTINTQEKVTSGCVLLTDDRMVFSCYFMCRVRSINKDESQDFNTDTLSPATFDIAYMEDHNTIAVTSGGDFPPCIRIIDLGTGEINEYIEVKPDCYGIVYRNNTLIYCTRSNLCMINLNDESRSVSEIVVEQMSNFPYIATYRDKLYYTNKDTHTVKCCDLNGNTQWEFKDESILRDPRGITLDIDGNVYVVGRSSCNVVVISTDGQNRRQLLGKEDGLKNPQVLHYESSTKRLLVANEHNVALLFKVTQLQ